MQNLKSQVASTFAYIRKIDKEYIKEKYHQLRHLRREDIIRFIKKSRKPIMFGVIGMFLVAIIIPIFTYLYFIRDMTTKERIINKKNAGVVLVDRNEVPFFTLFDATTKNPIPFDEIPEDMKNAIIAVEDKDFYNHPGFSITGIARAVEENLFSRSFAQGGSTISQQLIKNALLSFDKRLLRKYQELVLAIELERRYSKEDILEMYLNTIFFGEGAFGIQDASQKYFSKDAKDLTLAESALLAGIIRAPSALSPISGNLERALDRKDLILSLMKEQGYITEAEMRAAQKEKIVLKPTEDDINEEAVHFALMIQDMLIEEYGEQALANSGFEVKTTIDLELQKAAQLAVANQVRALSTSDVGNGAAVVIDPKTGEILALVGSHDWADDKNGRINMAVRPRQPGSSFKPFVYAKAIEEKKITASTQLDDEAIKFGSYEPKNYDNRFRGKVLTRYALANSLNIPAVHVLNMIGVSEGIEMAEDLGITTLDDDQDYGLALVLGAAEAPLIEMTNAYAAFANEGEQFEYSTFLEVRDRNGRLILENEPMKRRVMQASVAYVISSILSDNKARADVFGGSLTISRTAAVKTGTTNDYKDAWTIGYTPQVVVGVWIGNNDNTPMSSVAGSGGAGPIWRQIMEKALTGKPVEQFRKPTGVEEERVCFEDGLRVEKDYATTSAYLEYFVRGTKPSKLCASIPTATPTEDPKKKEEEEKKKKEEEEKKKREEELSRTPTPSPSPTGAVTPTSILPTTKPTGVTTTPAASPTSGGGIPTLIP